MFALLSCSCFGGVLCINQPAILQRSVDLDPRQKDVVLRVAELLCNLPGTDSRADFWVDRAAKLLPNHPTVFQLKVALFKQTCCPLNDNDHHITPAHPQYVLTAAGEAAQCTGAERQEPAI